MSSDYFEITIPYNFDNYESIQNMIYASGIENILDEDGSLKIYIEEDKEYLSDAIKSGLESIGIRNFTIKKFADKNWNAEWENSIQPVYIKNKVVVHSSWNKNSIENPGSKILIEIDPKMSFGTGHNETTQLVLEFMIDYMDETDKSMLDFGCGTAVLAIAAAKMGVKKIVAIDIDEDSIENAKEYIQINNVEKFIRLDNCDIPFVEESNFDLIAANIIRSVITVNLKHIHSKLKSGGKLFISGILNEEEKQLTAELQKFNFQIIEVRKKAEWLGICARKK
jgi:ribosomal protein L11 methyltransferase